tara:strand:+ start:23420 stop:23665 length:246 start_codon:yes stop_codon:yes gene_type:complete
MLEGFRLHETLQCFKVAVQSGRTTMKKVTKFEEIKEAIDNNQPLYLKDDELFCSFTTEFWMLCPLIMIFKSLAKGEIYREE